MPQKRLFGAPRDVYHDFLRQQGTEVATYDPSGFLLATLLVYLKKQQINLMKSEYDELATFLTKERESTNFLLTSAHKRDFLDKLGGPFSVQELCSYYNQFNGTSEDDVGEPLLDGIRAFQQSLSQVDDNSVILFTIG